MLNRKAKQIGCKNTYFITPNGLDAEDENGKHHTTAKDLALIMRYAVKNETFLHIAQTRDYTFSEITGKRTFSVHNANAFLDMRDGVLAGKTGYTSQAGYCYVCAWEKRAKHLSSASLAVGGPTTKPINGVIQRNCWTSEITTMSTKPTGKNHRPENPGNRRCGRWSGYRNENLSER